jgi:hypothetical protein
MFFKLPCEFIAYIVFNLHDYLLLCGYMCVIKSDYYYCGYFFYFDDNKYLLLYLEID